MYYQAINHSNWYMWLALSIILFVIGIWGIYKAIRDYRRKKIGKYTLNTCIRRKLKRVCALFMVIIGGSLFTLTLPTIYYKYCRIIEQYPFLIGVSIISLILGALLLLFLAKYVYPSKHNKESNDANNPSGSS